MLHLNPVGVVKNNILFVPAFAAIGYHYIHDYGINFELVIKIESHEKSLYLETIKVRLYIDKEGVDVHFTSRDRKKLAGFYNEVIAFEKSLNQHVSL